MHDAQRAAAQYQREQEQGRPSSTDRGYGSQWRKARSGYLAKHPLCVACARQGKATRATVVDHVKAWQAGATEDERKALFWDSTNWASLCASCHGVKCATVDGGFGRERASHPPTAGGISISRGTPSNRLGTDRAHACSVGVSGNRGVRR